MKQVFFTCFFHPYPHGENVYPENNAVKLYAKLLMNPAKFTPMQGRILVTLDKGGTSDCSRNALLRNFASG